MKSIFSYIFLAVFINVVYPQSDDLISETDYYTFHNNFWVNLHHFLYERASGAQAKKLEEDGLKLEWPEGISDLGELSTSQLKLIDEASRFYEQNMIKRQLRTGWNDLTVHLSKQNTDMLKPDSIISVDYSAVMNAVATIYKTEIWPLHQHFNSKLINKYLELVDDGEEMVINDMVRVSGDTWPDFKVRVDVTTYGSWAGAYSIIDPRMNLYISSLDTLNRTTTYVEVVFHESSHLLFSRDSPFRSAIYDKAQELDIPFPRGLWHASLFYLCGISTRKYLEAKAIDHKLQMVVKNIFSRSNSPAFRMALDAYFEERSSLDETVTALVKDTQR